MNILELNLVSLPEHVRAGFARLGEEAMANPGKAVQVPEELMNGWRDATAHLDGVMNEQLAEIRRRERRGWAAAQEALLGVAAAGASAALDQVSGAVVDQIVDAGASMALEATGTVVGGVVSVFA